MDQRLTFNEDLDNYEKWRTNYCDELFSEIIRYSGAGLGKLAVEIGCGTGKSTEPILKTGCQVIGVEYGANLAAYVGEKFKSYSNFRVENCKFEDFSCDSGSADIVFSATAFHWIPEEFGYRKVYDILKSSGTLALCWSFPSPDIERPVLGEMMRNIYARYETNSRLKPHAENYKEHSLSILKTIEKYGFTESEYYSYQKIKTYSANDYLSLLNTYATHLLIQPDSKRKQYEIEIKDAIDSVGGTIAIWDDMDLYLAKKP